MHKKKLYEFVNDSNNETIEYLAESAGPILTTISLDNPMIASGLDSYKKFNKVVMDNPSYKKYRGKAPFTKTEMKSMLWKKVKQTNNNVKRTKKFLDYIEAMGGFKKFEDFLLMMYIQDDFLKGDKDMLRKIKLKNIKEEEKEKLKSKISNKMSSMRSSEKLKKK